MSTAAPRYSKWRQLELAAAALIALPFATRALGLTTDTATTVVILAIAALGLNLCVGYAGLVSFGHGAWFGIGAYTAALIQKNLFPGQIVLPIALSVVIVGALATFVGIVILRRRGVYFSLLTLALSALSYTIAFRWTDVTGGENGLSNLERGRIGPINLDIALAYYGLIALIALGVVYVLLRVLRSPFGHVVVAIRENQLRAGFQGYQVERYKLAVFVLSAMITGLAGGLLGFLTYLVSAEGVSVPFSGELLAMVVIGGMRSLFGPALGALFFILFRELFSIWTADWLLWFGLIFVCFVVFSPNGLIGIWAQLRARWRSQPDEAATSKRHVYDNLPLPAFLRPDRARGTVLTVDNVSKSFGGIRAVTDASLTVEAGVLSYGGQRLVDLGIALGCKPQVLLLDEPLAGLPAAERERVSNLVKNIASNIPVLIVEHDIDRVLGFSHRVTVMNQGEILMTGTPAEVRNDQRVQEIYTGTGAIDAQAGRNAPATVVAKPILRAQNINTFYGKSHILHGAAIDVRQGEIVALVGRNGAGKTTLLRSLNGLVPPASGTIEYEGRNIAGLPAPDIARLGVGYVPQGRQLFAGMTVAENLALGRLARPADGSGVAWSNDKIFEYFPRLKERMNVHADFLSGGEQQMLAVARAMCGQVKLLLLDEPFEGLAPNIVKDLFKVFDQLRGSISIIIVEHNLDMVLALADRVFALDRGATIHEGPAQALLTDLTYRKQILWV